MNNKFLLWGALSGFFVVAFGAFATHILSATLDEKAMGWIYTGIRYQMFHTVALVALGLFQIANNQQNPPACRAKAFNIIGGGWLIGVLLFSGNLYVRALGIPTIHWITPIGGFAFLVGWAALSYIAFRSRNKA